VRIKQPFIQNVIVYDKRLLDFEPPPEEVIASDQKRLIIDTYAVKIDGEGADHHEGIRHHGHHRQRPFPWQQELKRKQSWLLKTFG